jgi:co-chaperonin GroES (HSP10)
MSIVKMKAEMSRVGIWPAGDRVLVKPDPIDDGLKTNKIHLPDAVKEKYQQAQATGTLVAVGPDAFQHITEKTYMIHDGGREELVEKKVRGYSQAFANVGDRVAFAKYSGLRVRGQDGESYIILNDEDITARVGDGVEFTELDTRKALGDQERV